VREPEQNLDVSVGGARAFTAAATFNLLVAFVAWLIGTSRHGMSGYDAISYHYNEWLTPIGLALFATVSLAALLTAPGRRWVGAGLVGGAVLAGVLDCAWTLVYFVSQGS
jgi:hypothetical protein